MRHSLLKRKLRLQSLESRQLMAANVFCLTPSEQTAPPPAIEAFFAHETTFSQADAGSTRNTAARIGQVDGTRTLTEIGGNSVSIDSR